MARSLTYKPSFLPKPLWYIDKHIPVINAIPHEQHLEIAQAKEEAAAKELHEKLSRHQEPLLHFHFEGLKMSNWVQKLFELSNGNQKEVVTAQRQHGMELFQIIALTTRIQQLQTHYLKHKKDKHSKQGMHA